MWIAAIPVVGKFVILGISGLLIVTVSTNFLILAAFASCLVVFVYPLFLLGTVTPCLVKATVESLDDSGRTVGRLGACNTVGSILGTFLPTFVTIPTVGTAVTFLIFGGILLALALAFFLSSRRGLRAVIIGALLFVLCALFGRSTAFAFWEDGLAYEGESVYNYLQVKEDDERVVLSTNVLFGIQSVTVKDGSLTGLYYDYALAAPVLCDEGKPLSVLVLGNGTGTFARQCRRYFPGCRVEGVEIDGQITALAHRYFDMPPEIAVTEKYDVILVDAYQDITIPFQMSSVEFFTLVREHLTDGGVMVVNMNMHADGADSINARLCDTIAAVFPVCMTADVPYSTNRELFACVDGEFPARLEQGIARLPEGALKNLMGRVLLSLTPVSAGGHILTDDCAPVELLGMRAIDGLIADELGYYKDIFRRGGIQGILDEIQ